jgi:hypothetical protein
LRFNFVVICPLSPPPPPPLAGVAGIVYGGFDGSAALEDLWAWSSAANKWYAAASCTVFL